MGYEEKQIPALMVRSKPEVGRDRITIHTIKQYRKLIAQKLGLPNKETVLVAWYIARAMELEYRSTLPEIPNKSPNEPTLKSTARSGGPHKSNPPKRNPAKRTTRNTICTAPMLGPYVTYQPIEFQGSAKHCERQNATLRRFQRFDGPSVSPLKRPVIRAETQQNRYFVTSL